MYYKCVCVCVCVSVCSQMRDTLFGFGSFYDVVVCAGYLKMDAHKHNFFFLLYLCFYPFRSVLFILSRHQICNHGGASIFYWYLIYIFLPSVFDSALVFFYIIVCVSAHYIVNYIFLVWEPNRFPYLSIIYIAEMYRSKRCKECLNKKPRVTEGNRLINF